jgi:hypothetical protein
MSLSEILSSLFLFGLFIAFVILSFFLRKLYIRSLGESEDAKKIVQRAEEKARTIVANASTEAREMRLVMEKERTQALNKDAKEIDAFIEAYRYRLEKSVKELSYGVEKEYTRATERFVDSLRSLEEKVAQNADEAKKSMDSFTSQSSTLFERLAYEIQSVEKGIKHLALALEEAAANESDRNAQIVRDEMKKIGKETAEAVVRVAQGLDESLRVNLEKEFSSIAGEVARYREARMRLIDERILMLLEETTQIALQRKLSMQEQADLVYRSLEEAKQRGIFV